MPLRFKPLFFWIAGWVCAGASAFAAPFRVGVEKDLYPISFVDEQGAPVGFAIDLMNAISQETRLDVEYVVKPRSEMFEDFRARRVDAIASVVYMQNRESSMALSSRILDLQGTMFVRKGLGTHHQRVEDLRNLRVAAPPNGYGSDYLKSHKVDQSTVSTPTLRDAMYAIEEGRADAAVGARLFCMEIIRSDRLVNVVPSSVVLPDLLYHYHIAVQPGDNVRLAHINDALTVLRADGTYEKIYEKWVGPLEPRLLRFKDVQRYIFPAALLLLGILAALVWQRRMFQRLARQAEALRQSEEQLTLVLEGSQDGFWDWNLSTGHITRSARWASMLGYDLGEIEPTLNGGRKLVHPDDLPVYDNTRLTSDASDRCEVEYRMRNKSGDWRWILDRGKIVARSPDGTPLRMAGTDTDITERKRTDAALRESELLLKRSAHFLEQTQSAAHIGGWEMDVKTNRIFWTEETYRIHGTTFATFLPTIEKVVEFYTPDTRASFVAALEQARRLGTPFDLELELPRTGQRATSIQAIGRAERENGRVTKIYGSIRDITEQKNTAEERNKLQHKMLEAQKLESLGVLAGGIAHDFNNLLTVILANASLARLRPDNAADPTESMGCDELLAQIENAAKRAADMCRQMLAYAGKGSFLLKRVDLSALVQDTARLPGISISKKAHLQFALGQDLPAVTADPSQLRQVVMNLMINAAEALGDAPGEIRLATYRGRLTNAPDGIAYSFDLPPGDCACLEVSDTGSGMAPETLARIFDPFFTTKFAGRGLGLAAVLGIVRAHHGALNVRSSIGHGTVFSLYLPFAAGEVPTTPGSSKPSRRAKVSNNNILIADDEPSVLTSTSAVLRRYGYVTTLANDGTEAVELFRASPKAFAAVLLDLTMPRLNGAEVLREIRAINPQVHVLLMSGYSAQDVLDRLQGQDNVAILQKPFSQDSLINGINQAIASNPPHP